MSAAHNAAELERLDTFLASVMAGLTPEARAQATRRMAAMLRTSQSRRIAAQRNPDGSAFEDRRSPKAPPKASNRAKKFMYPAGGSAAPRLVLLKSWVRQGPLITGYDVEAAGIRSFEIAKVTEWLRPSASEQNAAARPLRQRAKARSRVMFRKLGTSRNLRAGSSSDEAWVGFAGLYAWIARVHQEGQLSRVSPRGPRIRYPMRQLLGLTKQEDSALLDLLIAMVEPS